MKNEKKQKGVFYKVPVALMVCIFVLGGMYLYTTNRIAVQGYTIGEREKQLALLKRDNNQLRIEEAELKSLYRIEEAGKRLNMFEPTQIHYVDESNTLALR
jgi:hypothetical protein